MPCLPVTPLLLLLPALSHAVVIWVVPVHNFVKIWGDERNPSCHLGSVWRPVLDDIDPGDGIKRPPILLGDIFLESTGPPNFVANVLVVDEDLDSCYFEDDQGLPISTYACFEATPERGQGTPVPPLFASTEFPMPNATVWTARAAQCMCTETPLFGQPCTSNAAGSERPWLTGEEDGFILQEDKFQIMAPLCPDNYHILGHVGTLSGVAVPDNYQCIHKRLLRRAGNPDGSEMYLNTVQYIGDPAPVQTATVWTTHSTDNPTIVPEYYQDVKIYNPNCGFPGCDQEDFNLCRNDTLSQGLFYAGVFPPMRITASRNPDDFANLAPEVGPRCLVPYRFCEDDCDLELGQHLFAGQEQPRRGLVYAKPWGGPVECVPEDGCVEELGITTELYFDRAVCDQMMTRADGAWIDGEISTFPYVLMNQHAPDEIPLQNAFRVTNVLHAPAFTWCTWIITFDFFTMQRVGVKPGPVTMHFFNWDGTPLTLQDDTFLITYNVGISLGKFYLYEPPRDGAQLSPEVVYNGECQSPVFIAMPPHVNMMNYNTFFQCSWRPYGSTDDFRAIENTRRWLGSTPRGIFCSAPARTDPVIEFQVSLNGVNRHTIHQRLEKKDPTPGVPGKEALRLYSITPRSGPSRGGTQITLHGKHFSYYRENHLMCRFTFVNQGQFSDLDYTALYIDDQRIQCTSPPALQFVNEATVEVSVDGGEFCAAEAVAGQWYNRATFYYTQQGEEENVAWTDPWMTWTKCHSYTGIFPTTPRYPVSTSIPTPVVTCDTLPNQPELISELGYFGCVNGMDDPDDPPHSADNPAWCMRAVPANGGTSYMFWLYDPFWKLHGYMLRPVPVVYPGTCVRHRAAWDHNVLIRFQIIFDLIPSPGLTVDEEWEFFKVQVEQEILSLEGVDFGAGFLRQTRDERELFVDYELNSKLQNKQDLVALLNGLRDQVMVGKQERGRYYSSNLTVAGVKALAMTEPTVEEEQKYRRWELQLDYRVNSIHSAGQALPPLSNATTQGKRLLEKIMSNHALSYIDGRDMSYMKDALHRIGEAYGFIDLTTNAFYVEWDATVATEYDEVKYRQQSLCAKSGEQSFNRYSGMVGDDESYIDWFDLDWTKGRPICKNPNCAEPPFAEPAEGNVNQGVLDTSLGCVRLRVGFNCTDFDMGRCMKEKSDPGYNFAAARQYAHVGVRSEHLNDTNWCNAYYPEAWGPNNPTQDPVKQAEYRYRYRLSPCIACRQARDICNEVRKSTGADDGVDRRDNGDLDFSAEIDLGCFGMAHSGGAVQDMCCDNACDHIACSKGLEACIRAKNNPICADPRHAQKDLHDSCDVGPPLCSPRVFV